jgi:hypothetical protein
MERAAEVLRAWGSSRAPQSGALIPDPAVAPAVMRAFTLRATGARIHEVIAMLERDWPRGGGLLWSHTQVKRMLSSRVYLGEVRQGGIVVPDAHEPLVDPVTFAAVQGIPPRIATRSANAEFHLRGVIRCAGCSLPTTGWNQPRLRASGEVDRVRVYRCARQRQGGRCESGAVISADAVERLVREPIEPYVRDLVADASLASVGAGTRAAAVRADLQHVEERLRRLTADLHDELEPDVWQTMVAELSARRRALLDEQEQLTSSVAPSPTSWRDLSTAEQFEVMREALDAVIVRRATRNRQPPEERVSLYRAGTLGDLLPPHRGARRPQPFDFEASEAAASARAA